MVQTKTIKLDDSSYSLREEAKKLHDMGVLSTSVLLKEKDGKKHMQQKPKSFDNLNKTNCLTSVRNDHNCLTVLTGERSSLVVLDIDNKMDAKIGNGLNFWEKTIAKNGDIDTWKVKTGNNGYHYYFLYDSRTKNFKTKSNITIDNKKYSIDIRNEKGLIYAPPTVYESENGYKKYMWLNSPFDTKLSEMPDWLYDMISHNDNMLGKPKVTKKKHIVHEPAEDVNFEAQDDEFADNLICDDTELRELVNMLSKDRRDNYEDWIKVGMCIFNITNGYGIQIWKEWSEKSKKYVINDCENKWRTFKKNGNNELQKGSLLYWIKQDGLDEYTTFKTKKQGALIIANKFPKLDLVLGETVTFKDRKCIKLHGDTCVLSGKKHQNMPNSCYVDIVENRVDIKCMHMDCFAKSFPCPSFRLNKQESQIINYNTLNVTVNNYTDNDDLIEFDKFNIFDDEKVNELMYNSLNGADDSFADILFYLYKNNYNYGEDNNWYMFENHRWLNIGNKNHYMQEFGRQKIKEYYTDLINYCKKENMENIKIKEIRKIKNTVAKQKVMRDAIDGAKSKFLVNNNRNRNFVKKLDTNSSLICFNNGVYDLDKHIFRDGTPEDLLTMSVGYKYSPNKSKEYDSLLHFLNDIQPDKKEREYLLTFLSTALFGNSLELFTILTGKGRNGKSKLIELLKMTFGDYYGSVKSQLFTRPQPDASSPDPGLLNLRKKKLVISSEPEKNQKLNSGFIKFITGRDSTQLRACHQNEMVDFEPQFVTLFVCNDIPETDDLDTAFSKRLRCINFPTEFCDKPVKENQKQINIAINKKFNSWRNDLMLLLLEHYKVYQTENKLVATKNILKWTKKYESETDVYLQFLNECTEEKEGERLKMKTIVEHFRDWWKGNINPVPPGRNTVIHGFRKHLEIKKIKISNIMAIGVKNIVIIDLI